MYVNNAVICEFDIDSGDINASMGHGKKTLKCNVVPTFEDLKKPVVEKKGNPQRQENHSLRKLGSLCRNK